MAGAAGCLAVKTVSNLFFSPHVRRPFPDNTLQTVADIQRFVRETREQNPAAVIVVAGHGLGGHVAADASRPMADDPVSNKIDLLALIDPYASSRLKDGSEVDDSELALPVRTMPAAFCHGDSSLGTTGGIV